MANNKKILFASLAAAVVFAMVAEPALAATTTSSKGDFCSRLSTYSSNMTQQISDRETKLTDAEAQREANFTSRQAEREAKLAEARTKWDADRTASYDKLMAKATTDEQKAAVAAFQNTVEQAVTTRRAAIDAAINDFRNGEKQAVESRKTDMDAIVLTYKTAIQTAEAKAVADCASGVSALTVRATLVASAKSARDKYKIDRQAVEKVGEKVKQLNEVRKQAFDKALADFKAAVEAAKVQLKAVFPAESNTSATTTTTTAQ